MTPSKPTLILLFLCVIGFTANASNIVYLTVAYCPTYFTGAGAVVAVDTDTMDWKIVGNWTWPDLFGCVANYDPTVISGANGEIFFDFTSDFGFVTTIDLPSAKLVHSVAPKDPFFVGYVNAAWDGSEKMLLGAQPVGKDDGEFQWVALSPQSGNDKIGQFIPFREMSDDSHVYDKSTNTFYVQCGYDKRNTTCAPIDSDLCLLDLDSTTGALRSAKWTNWTAYKYGATTKPSDVLAFIEGFESLCQHPYNNFLFARLDLETAKATPVACMEKSVTLQEDEWIASFSRDEKVFATGSRWDGNTQLLLLDTQTGKAIQNSHLPGLETALGGVDKLFWIWSVDFA